MHLSTPGLALLALAIAFRANPSPRQDPPAERKEAAAQTQRTPKFPLDVGEYSLHDLVMKSAEFLGRNHLIDLREDPQAQTRSVTITKRLELDAAGCEEVVSQLLYTANWAMTPVDPARGIYEFVFLAGPRRLEVRKRATFATPEEVLARPGLKTLVTVSVPLEHADATRMAGALGPLLQQFQSGMDSATAIVPSNALVVTGFRDTVAETIRLLQKLDRPAPRIQQSLEERLQQIEKRLGAIEADPKRK